MKIKKKIPSLLLVLMLLLAGCGNNSSSTDDKNNNSNNDANTNTGTTSIIDEADMFTDRDYKTEYDESKSVLIQLNGDSASCSSDAVKISGTTITITDEGTFILSGTLNDGMIIVNAQETDKPQIVLNGASITSKTSAALYIFEADKVFVTLADGTSNTLANGGTFTAIDDNNIDGAIFSKQDLTFNGNGSLTVTSPADHGIVCKDDLVFTSGTYTVASASHGLDANDSVRICNASISIDAGKDGIHAENSDDTSLGFVYIASGTFDIEAEGDGISSGNCMQIKDGSLDIVAGGGSENGSKSHSDSYGGFPVGGMGGGRPGRTSSSSSSSSSTSSDESTSMKALKAASNIVIDGGDFTIDSADDSIHSNANVTINNGTFDMASGDDAIHADETLTITNGTIKITESYEGLEGQKIYVSGGDITLKASDDGLNSAGGTDSSGTGGRDTMFGGGGFGGGMSSSSKGVIEISGGTLYINASGDGIDSNGSLTISGGHTTVVGPTQGDTATLDYDTTATITGGTFIGTGASGMAQTFSESKQGVIAVSVGNHSARTSIILKDSKGNTVISYEPELSFAIVILSSPDIVKGETYTITVGSASGSFEAS